MSSWRASRNQCRNSRTRPSLYALASPTTGSSTNPHQYRVRHLTSSVGPLAAYTVATSKQCAELLNRFLPTLSFHLRMGKLICLLLLTTRTLGELSCRIDEASLCLSQYGMVFNCCGHMLHWVLRRAGRVCARHWPMNPESCANNHSIPVYRLTIVHPILTAQEP